MTTPYTVTQVRGQNDVYGWLFTWVFTGVDTGQVVDPNFMAFIDRSVQATGTGMTWEGSNDNVTWGALNDPFGNALVITDTKPHGVTEAVAYSRPNNIGGGAITVTLTARRGLR
jgi:hypothetical protein